MNNQIDPSAILQEAVELAKKGFHVEALHRHLWFHQHALELRPALYGVRLSFALSYWVDLGKAYPPALDALKAIRDRKLDELAAGGGSCQSFHDVVAINDNIGELTRTTELFRLLDARNPEMARECYSSAENALVAAHEYGLCERYMADLDARLESIKSHRESLIQFHENLGRPLPPEVLRIPDVHFARDVGHLIEILSGVGRTADAARVRNWALAISDCSEVREVLGISQSPP
jgi:hypothetical protein